MLPSHLSPRPVLHWPGPRTRRAIADQAHFLKTLIDRPRLTGSVAPSGRFLARAMAQAVDPSRDGLVIELGPGTGPVTQALVERGISRQRLVLIEYDQGFCRLLAQRFPGVRVVQGDAYDLPKSLAALVDQPIAAVVSSLPLP
jgi:phosphatidylethanolamine/phosphatidyl-N-methylethanolamine N-methyltransferase